MGKNFPSVMSSGPNGSGFRTKESRFNSEPQNSIFAFIVARDATSPKYLYKSATTSRARSLPGAFLIPPALLVVADLTASAATRISYLF
jgi:hypothetical protein